MMRFNKTQNAICVYDNDTGDEIEHLYTMMDVTNKIHAESVKLKEFASKAISLAKNNHGYHGDNDDERCGEEDCMGCTLEDQLK